MRQTKLDHSSGAPRRYWWIGCLLLLLITGKGSADKSWAATGEPGGEKMAAAPGMLKLQDGVLTAHIPAASLQHVLGEVSRLSGARIVWLGQRDERQVSVDFMALPLVEAMQRLLEPHNFLLVYASAAKEARLMEIWIASRRSAARQTVPSALDPASVEDDPTSGEVAAELERMLESHLDTALHGAERDSRIEAIGFLGGLVEQDPRIRPVLQQLSAAEGDPHVRAAAAEALAGLAE